MNRSPAEFFCTNLTASESQELVSELVGSLALGGAIPDAAAFAAAVWARELQQRTWLGREAALPHARIAGVHRMSLVLGTHRTGVTWGSNDQRARLFFLVAVPLNRGVDYLYLTQRITRTLRDDARRAALLAAPDENALAAAWRAGS